MGSCHDGALLVASSLEWSYRPNWPFQLQDGLAWWGCPFLSRVILGYGSKGIWVGHDDWKLCVEGCLDDDRWIKDGNPWANRESVFKYGDKKCGVGSWTLFCAKLMRDTAREPHKIPTVPSNCPLTEDEEDCLKKAEKQWDNYNQCKATVKAQIIMTIPDSLLIEIQKLNTARKFGMPCVPSMKTDHYHKDWSMVSHVWNEVQWWDTGLNPPGIFVEDAGAARWDGWRTHRHWSHYCHPWLAR